MAAKKKLTPQQQRDRRAKMMLGVLGVVLLAVLGFQLPSLLKGSGSSAPPPAPAATGTPGAAPSSAPSQLASFSRFAPKDPFKPGVNLAAIGSTSAGSTTPSAPAPAPPPKPAPKPKPTTGSQLTISVAQQPAPVVPTVPAALLLVDGKKHVLPLDQGFPTRRPFFKVVALSDRAVWVELVGGTLANGQQTVKLDRGRRVTLLDATAGLRVVLVMVKPTTAPKAALVAPARPATTTSGG